MLSLGFSVDEGQDEARAPEEARGAPGHGARPGLPRSPRGNPFRLLPLALAGGLLLTGAVGCGEERRPEVPATDASPADRAPAAEPWSAEQRPAAAPAARPGIEREPYLGVVVPRETVEISADVSGRLESVAVRVGDRVEAGDLLARVDVRPLRQELSGAEAALSAARSELDRRAAELAEVERRHRRREAIPETFSREELEATALELETARAAHEGAKARLEEQQARVRRLRELLDDAVLRAPFPGTVALRHLDAGATVAPGTRIVRLIAADELFVRFAVPAEQAAELEAGSRVEVALEGLAERLTGRIQQIAPEIDPGSRLVFVEARIEASRLDAGAVRTGLVARVSLGGGPSA